MPTDPTCHCTALRRTAQHLSNLYDQALSEAGLKVTQLALLRTIARLENPNLKTLSLEMGLDRSTLGRNVRVLERMRLVRLVEDETDERATVVELTGEGGRMLTRAAKRWEQVQARVEAALSKADLKRLHDVLKQLETI